MHMHIIGLFVLIIAVIPFWRIVSKAGYNGAWALLMFIPLVNLIMLYVFAFNTWPTEQSRPQ
jgi:Na+/melibiose symporter-like transporter